jgi:MGT family glycosyltransferase
MLWAYRNNIKVMRLIDKDWDTSGMLRGVSPYLYMLFSTDKLEYPRKAFIPEIFYVGPSLLEHKEDQLPDFPWEKLDASRALIYVATGTIQYHAYRQLYQNIIKALAEDVFPGHIQVVMAVGKGQALEAFGMLPANFIIVPYAPQVKLLKRASVFITHGGANSVNEALSYGKPLLVIASGRDPISVAQRVAYNGAGISLKPGQATARAIRRSISELLQNPRYARAAEGIMASYRRCNGPLTAAGLILKLAESRAPLRRKPGAPITLHHIDELPNYTDGTL